MSRPVSRRSAIRTISTAGLTIFVYPYIAPESLAEERNTSSPESSILPIDRSLRDVAERRWFGDEPSLAHSVIRDQSHTSRTGSHPGGPPAEHVPIVIVGGGIAGLVSAFQLRTYKPILLEQSARFGGNSKGQSWRGIDYSIGAAYVSTPSPGGEMDTLFKEIGLSYVTPKEAEAAPVALGNKVFSDFWSGDCATHDPPQHTQLLKLATYIRKVQEGREFLYPMVPPPTKQYDRYIKSLDHMNLRTHLEQIVGGELLPLVAAKIEEYCWSSFGAPSSAIGTAGGMNFLAGEFGSILAFPGGNAAIAQRLVESLLTALPVGHLRPNALVHDVSIEGDHVHVRYQDTAGASHHISCDVAIMACPKFVVSKVLKCTSHNMI